MTSLSARAGCTRHPCRLQAAGRLAAPVLLLALFLPWATAADQVPGDHRVVRPTEPVTLIELRLDRGLHTGRDTVPVILHLYRRGKTITSGWGMAGCSSAPTKAWSAMTCASSDGMTTTRPGDRP